MKRSWKIQVMVLQCLMMGLFALFVFSCGSKKKTVEKERHHIESRTESKTNTVKNKKTRLKVKRQDFDNLSSIENVNVSKTLNDYDIELTPVDPTKPSQANINGQPVDFQNANVNISHRQEETDSTGHKETEETHKNECETELFDNTKTDKTKKKKMDKTDSGRTVKKDKEREGGLPWWIWLVGAGVLIILGVRMYFKKSFTPF